MYLPINFGNALQNAAVEVVGGSGHSEASPGIPLLVHIGECGRVELCGKERRT